MNFTPTIEQENVKIYFEARLEEAIYTSIFLNAVAGSGKTSTIMYLIEVLKNTGRFFNACSLSFNTNIRDASQKKLDDMKSGVKARTTNQLGRAILVDAAKRKLCAMPEGKADGKKYDTIARDLLDGYKNDATYFPIQKTRYKDYSKCLYGTLEVINALRNTRTTATAENIIELVLHYRMEEKVNVFAPWFPLIVSMSGVIIETGIDAYNSGYCTKAGKTFKTGWHNFDDQICLPLDLDLISRDWDIIFCDEAQDLNTARLQMITRAIKENGLLFFVGDPSQSIQGFTYSDTQAVETIKTVTGAREFPLSVCWRCDENIIRLAQALVSHIQARPAALAGRVDTVDADELMKNLEQGDLVLCRVKAPLVDWCLRAIRAGFTAKVRGRDIGTSTIALLNELLDGGATVNSLLVALDDWEHKESQKVLGKKDEEALLQAIQDKAATLAALYEGYIIHLSNIYDESDVSGFTNSEDLIDFISSKFSDDENAINGIKPIIFSTVHKAKGLEYPRVFILHPEKMPHPMACEGWQTVQEYNILYVAITRAMKELYFVGCIPAPLQDTYNTMMEEAAALEASRVTVTEVYEELPVLQIAAPALEEWNALSVIEALETNQPEEETATALVIEGLEEEASELEENEIVLETATQGQETAAALDAHKPAGKKGRPALASSDKVVQRFIRTDPDMKEALSGFVASLENTEFHDLIPFAGKSLAVNDIIIAALLSYEPFMNFFQASPQWARYIERQARLNPGFQLPGKPARQPETTPAALEEEASQEPTPDELALEKEYNNKESICMECHTILKNEDIDTYPGENAPCGHKKTGYFDIADIEPALEEEKIVESTIEASQPGPREAGIVQDKDGNQFVLLHLFGE